MNQQIFVWPPLIFLSSSATIRIKLERLSVDGRKVVILLERKLKLQSIVCVLFTSIVYGPSVCFVHIRDCILQSNNSCYFLLYMHICTGDLCHIFRAVFLWETIVRNWNMLTRFTILTIHWPVTTKQRYSYFVSQALN